MLVNGSLAPEAATRTSQSDSKPCRKRLGIDSLERRKKMLASVANQMHWNAIVSDAVESETDANSLRSSRSKICVETWGTHERTFWFSGYTSVRYGRIFEDPPSGFSKSCNSLADECNAHAQQDQRNGKIELPSVYRPDQADAQPTGRHR